MDEADLAQQSIEFHLNHNLTRIKAQVSGIGSFTCDECGEEIPKARRLALPGCRLCIGCQKERETSPFEKGGSRGIL